MIRVDSDQAVVSEVILEVQVEQRSFSHQTLSEVSQQSEVADGEWRDHSQALEAGVAPTMTFLS